ncbi:MAG: hypothetical protein WBF49_07250, partial [Methyloceanibacter sp.]
VSRPSARIPRGRIFPKLKRKWPALAEAGPAMTAGRDTRPALIHGVRGDETDRGNAQNCQKRAVEQDVRKSVVGINAQNRGLHS